MYTAFEQYGSENRFKNLALQMAEESWDVDTTAVAVESVLPVAQTPDAPEIKLFGRWNCEDVQVSDMSLQVEII